MSSPSSATCEKRDTLAISHLSTLHQVKQNWCDCREDQQGLGKKNSWSTDEARLLLIPSGVWGQVLTPSSEGGNAFVWRTILLRLSPESSPFHSHLHWCAWMMVMRCFSNCCTYLVSPMTFFHSWSMNDENVMRHLVATRPLKCYFVDDLKRLPSAFKFHVPLSEPLQWGEIIIATK